MAANDNLEAAIGYAHRVDRRKSPNNGFWDLDRSAATISGKLLGGKSPCDGLGKR